MFESFRAHWPHTTGIIQWMLNGARPGIYWQLYDYYKQPNAAYYGVKKANAPVQLIYDYYTKGVYAVNETLEPANVKAEMKLLKDGQTINNSQQIEIASGTVVKVFDIDTSGAPAAFLFLKLTDGKGNEVATNEYFLPSGDDTYDWSKTTWVNTPITQYASYDMLDGLCTKDCELTIKPSSEGLYKITVSNPTDKVAFMIRLVAKNRNGELICPAYWSDNYFSLAPGDSRTITCQTSSQRATIQVDMYDE
jgi:exo-1,4-beta-D-glucosaminidase